MEIQNIINDTQMHITINDSGNKSLKYQIAGPKTRIYVFVTLMAAWMVFLMFAVLDIYPFGNRSLVYADGDQYFGFLGYLQSTFFTNNNLLYSWSNVLGGGMIGTLAYYCASPFNLLTIFFRENLVLGYHFIFAVKFITAAVCFSVMLKHLFINADEKTILLFSVSYPFMGYMAYYAWNQSWMDGVIVLPVMLLGIWKLIKQERPLLYILSLAFILLSNYYIGFMLCITSVLLFLCTLVLTRAAFDKKTARICISYVISSVMAAALSAILLIPTLYSLPEGREKSVLELFRDMHYLCRPLDTFSMLYTHPLENMNYGNNYPIIYIGIVQFVLVVQFFLNKGIPKLYKTVAGGLLFVFLLSFSNSTLNRIWHGTSVNVWFNYRYSFVASFILELIAFYSFLHAREAKKHLLSCWGIIMGITVLIMNSSKGNVNVRTLFLDLTLICMFLLLMYMYCKGTARRICFMIIGVIMMGNLIGNAYLTLKNNLDNVDGYIKNMSAEKEVVEIIDDHGFYRRGSTLISGRCYAMLAGFSGVQNYASTENLDTLRTCDRLGVEQEWWWCRYNNHIPLSTDALLGMKYIVTAPAHKSEYYISKGQIPDKDLYVLENKNALPIIFPVEGRFQSGETPYNKFEYINNCWNSISSEGGNIFHKIDADIKSEPSGSGRDIHIKFSAYDNNPVYAFVPEGNRSLDVQEYSKYQDVFYIGKYPPGEQREIIIHADNSYQGDDEIVLYSEDQEILNHKASGVIEDNLWIEKKSSSHLNLLYQTKEEIILSSTIPFESGWHVYIDGKEVETYRNMDSFLAFGCPAGSHEIELIYWPRHFRMGAMISGISILMVIIMEIICIRTYRKKEGEAAI